ncbi:hypothetical protein HEQ69_10875 [Haematospirillum jordaniae]|uniref:virion core protein, T7 gp14 family n=1 Tax=Haematospirillum jordaniae TaxID=1549855 RepID=UPI00143347E8|nr:hypothetical protein [Haematospirillum jordaniae]NKD46206.1 hypothetical protein [Haematospirillum jordaniae]
MCDATALAFASLGLNAAGTVAGFMGQRDQARAQNQMYAENMRLANESALRMYSDSTTRQQQEMESAANEQMLALREARKAAATTRTAAGEAGLSGLSVDSLLADIYGQDATYRASIARKADWTMEQLQREKAGIRATAADRAHSMAPGTKPSFVNLGLQLGAQGMQTYSGYRRDKMLEESMKRK